MIRSANGAELRPALTSHAAPLGSDATAQRPASIPASAARQFEDATANDGNDNDCEDSAIGVPVEIATTPLPMSDRAIFADVPGRMPSVGILRIVRRAPFVRLSAAINAELQAIRMYPAGD